MSKTQSSENSDFFKSWKDAVTGTAAAIVKWCRDNPIAAALLATTSATLVYFFAMVPLFVNGAESTARWAWLAWNPEQDQEHSRVVPLIFLWLIWYHWDEVLKAPKSSSRLGLVFVGGGILLFLASSRCLEARIALVSLPFLLYGAILYVWGKNVARILLFPCAFLIFLIPFGPLQQATFRLQFIITDIISVMANVVGIHVRALGTTLSAQDSSFHFEVAEGCSGIHSIIAITMLTTIFMHIMEKVLWKKAVIVLSSVVFAIIGNIGRIFTIILVAKIFNANIAGGPYHEYSGYIIYPFAVGAMIGLSTLLNLHKDAPPGSAGDSPAPKSPKPRPPKPTYDYDY